MAWAADKTLGISEDGQLDSTQGVAAAWMVAALAGMHWQAMSDEAHLAEEAAAATHDCYMTVRTASQVQDIRKHTAHDGRVVWALARAARATTAKAEYENCILKDFVGCGFAVNE